MVSLPPKRRFSFAATLAPALTALMLAGCGSSGQGQQQEGEASTSTNQPAPVSDDVEASTVAAPERFSSAYGKLQFDDCAVTQEATEGYYVDRRCPGREGIAIFLHDGDGRYDLDAGVPNDQFQSIGAFNSIGDTLEWRLDNGTAFAVIFRLYDATREDRGRSVLAVEKIGTANSPGCRVAQIAGDTPQANQRARAIADTAAASFDCTSGQISFIGDAR